MFVLRTNALWDLNAILGVGFVVISSCLDFGPTSAVPSTNRIYR